MSTAAARPNRTHAVISTCSTNRERALLLDYDGTIAPFVVDRSCALPYPQIPELLDQIMARCDTRVVIVSGRTVKDLTLLLRTKCLPEIWGCHGLERLLPNGQYSCVHLGPETELALAEASLRLRDLALNGHFEQKPGCVAVHWRGQMPNRAEEIRALSYQVFSRFSGRNGLFISDFDGGLELRHRACTKRFAVETILSELRTDAAVAYLGDDITDEDAFRVLNGRGVTVLVRSTYRFTAAQFWLQPPDELRQFLTDWIHSCEEAK